MSAHGATSKPASTLIVGGGLAGLYAAHRLKKANIPDVLWEAQPGWGGRILALPIEGDWAPGRLGTRPAAVRSYAVGGESSNCIGSVIVDLPRGLGFSVANPGFDIRMKFGRAPLRRAKLQRRVRPA